MSTARDGDTTKVRDVIGGFVRSARMFKVSIKGFDKFEKQFCTLRHATRNNDRDLETGANVPFERDGSLANRALLNARKRSRLG